RHAEVGARFGGSHLLERTAAHSAGPRTAAEGRAGLSETHAERRRGQRGTRLRGLRQAFGRSRSQYALPATGAGECPPSPDAALARGMRHADGLTVTVQRFVAGELPAIPPSRKLRRLS